MYESELQFESVLQFPPGTVKLTPTFLRMNLCQK